MSFIIVPPAATGVTFPIVGTPDATMNGLGAAAGALGGTVFLNGGVGGAIGGAAVAVRGGDDTGFAAGGVLDLLGGLGGPAGSGGNVNVTGGNCFGGVGSVGGNAQITSGDSNGTPGNVVITVGSNGIATNGQLTISSTIGALAAPAGVQVVNIAGRGPGAAAVTVTKWLPVTLDGVAGFIPFFT